MLIAPVCIYSEAEVRALEAAHAATLSGDLFPLMQAAARAAFHVIAVHWPSAERIIVIAGSGNNGGDGLVLATLLQAAGRQVRVLATSPSSKASEASRARAEWLQAGGQIEQFREDLPLPEADLLVDAIFGIGLSRAPEGLSAAAIRWINQARLPVLALDLPSGVIGDTGHCPGDAVSATRTLSFIAAKPGVLVGAGLNHVGHLLIDDLNVPRSPSRADTLGASDIAFWTAARTPDTHKGDYGRAVILAGAPGMHGAALLSAGGALCAAPGYVCLCSTAVAEAASLVRHPEVMTSTEPEQRDAWLDRASAVLVGPGIGQGELGVATWHAWLRCFDAKAVPSILDADALNLLARAPRTLSTSVILTPHPTEAARLLGISTAQIQQDRIGAARALAARYQAIIVLKGAGSILAHPDGQLAVCRAGNPGMAVAGMGDVLSGLLVGLLAAHRDPWQVARTAVLVHARTADGLVQRHGYRRVQPSVLLRALGQEGFCS